MNGQICSKPTDRRFLLLNVVHLTNFSAEVVNTAWRGKYTHRIHGTGKFPIKVNQSVFQYIIVPWIQSSHGSYGKQTVSILKRPLVQPIRDEPFWRFFWQKPSPKTSSESPWKSLQLENEAFPFGTYNEGKYGSQLGGSPQLGSGSSVESNWTRDASLPMIWWCQTVKHMAEVLSIDLGLWPIVCPAASSSSPVQRRAARRSHKAKKQLGAANKPGGQTKPKASLKAKPQAKPA